MIYKKLGRTGIKVSVAGLGCGGHSKLGIRNAQGEDNAIKLLQTALDLGVNFFDTSPSYDTEEVIGKAFRNVHREKYVISTKFQPSNWGPNLRAEGDLTNSIDKSLKLMNLDYIDVFHLHGVLPELYVPSRDRFIPELIKAREAGKIRWLGITEYFNNDTSHVMGQHALSDDIWDVVMLGLNIINPSAIKSLLPDTIKNNVGTLVMFAVRTALSQNKRLIEIVAELEERGEINTTLLNINNPLDFLTENNVSKSITEAAYRFCRHIPGIDVVLTGTSSVDHLQDNIKSILAPPLPNEIQKKIMSVFGNVDSVSGQ